MRNAYTDGDEYSNKHADGNSDVNGHVNKYADQYTDGNGNSDGNSDRHGNSDGKLHTGNGMADGCSIPDARRIRCGGDIQRYDGVPGGRLQLLGQRQRQCL